MFASVGLANGSVKVSLGFAYTEHLKPSFMLFSEVLHKVQLLRRAALAAGPRRDRSDVRTRSTRRIVAGATLSLGRRYPRLGALHHDSVLSLTAHPLKLGQPG
jgi:hypothetical protein